MTQLTWNKMPAWIARSGVLRDLSPSAPALLIALLSHADEQGSIRMAQADAGHMAGISESSAKRAFGELLEFGIIEIIEPKSGRRPAHIRVCGVTVDGSSLTGHGRRVNVDRSSMTPLRPVDRSWVTPLDTHIGTRVRRKEERERENISLSGFQDWHPKARAVNDDAESRTAYESFEAKFTPQYYDEQERPCQIVAMFLARQPKALKVGWTIPRLVEVAEAMQTHEHLTVEQALVEMMVLDNAALAKKTRMGIPQHDELIAALRKCEQRNLNRERVCGSEQPNPRDADYIAYARNLNPEGQRKILGHTRKAILSEPHGENTVAMHWDARLGSDPLTTLRHDWLGDMAGGRWLRARAIQATPKAKETA